MAIDDAHFGDFNVDRQAHFVHHFFDGSGDTVYCFVDGPCYFFYHRSFGDGGQGDFDFDSWWLTDSWRSGPAPTIRFGWMARRFRRWIRRRGPRPRTAFP